MYHNTKGILEALTGTHWCWRAYTEGKALPKTKA